jgi:hypothetical protein
MKKKPLKVALTAVAFGSLITVCGGQSNTPTSGRTYNVGDTKIKVLIPPEMDVAMTPQHLEPDTGSALFHYKLKVSGKKAPQMLHWSVYVSDAGKVVDKASWNDRDELSLDTEVEKDAVLYCDVKPGAKLTIVLGEMAYDEGVKKISEDALEQNLEQVLAGRAALPKPRFVAHADLSDDDNGALMKRSLDWILTKEAFRKDVKLSLPALLLSDEPNMAPPSPDVQLIGKEFVREKFKVGESIKYLKYEGTWVLGDRLTVYFQYHTPSVQSKGAIIVDMGIRIKFTYLKQQSKIILKEVYTEHF